MQILERVQGWFRAMEDIEDPAGSELRQLRERILVLEAQQAAQRTDDQRDAL